MSATTDPSPKPSENSQEGEGLVSSDLLDAYRNREKEAYHEWEMSWRPNLTKGSAAAYQKLLLAQRLLKSACEQASNSHFALQL